MMLRQRQPPEHDEAHLDFIRSLPCCVCGDPTSTEAAHISYGDPMILKKGRGLGQKEDDRWTVPLCNRHHRESHDYGNEVRWWKIVAGLDPIKIAQALYIVSKLGGGYELAERIALRRL
jgi:hypothetical protein